MIKWGIVKKPKRIKEVIMAADYVWRKIMYKRKYLLNFMVGKASSKKENK